MTQPKHLHMVRMFDWPLRLFRPAPQPESRPETWPEGASFQTPQIQPLTPFERRTFAKLWSKSQ